MTKPKDDRPGDAIDMAMRGVKFVGIVVLASFVLLVIIQYLL